MAFDWLLIESEIFILLAGSSSELRNRAPAPLVSKIKVKVADLETRIKPISHTVSDDEEFEIYKASSVHIWVALILGYAGLLLDKVV